jgi:hypothetical protein
MRESFMSKIDTHSSLISSFILLFLLVPVFRENKKADGSEWTMNSVKHQKLSGKRVEINED